jgi:lipopolysaccharide/colanic/teichoic acid biosynthesis glycosyltransferase
LQRKSQGYNKRIFDVVLAIKLLALSPIIILSLKKKGQLFSNIFAVLKGNLSWVGYAIPIDTSLLPNIKPGIIPCADIEQSEAREEIVNKENLYYARNYNWWKDFEIILKNINHLDAKIK